MGPAYTVALVSLAVRVKATGCVVGESMKLQVRVCVLQWDLPPNNGACDFRGGGMGVELWVLLPILPVVSRFSS
jgi:hypothetical protein